MTNPFNKITNAILLAGGNGTRLLPLSGTISKHLITINGKFVIDYPIATLKQMGVENLTVVLGGSHFEQIVEYLKDGSDFDLNINYIFQKQPNGIAAAINLCKQQVYNKDNFVCILGDNLFSHSINWKQNIDNKAQVALYNHLELQRFGVASLKNSQVVKIEEKPKELDEQLFNHAITGCYLFNQKFFEYFQEIKPSSRNEYEITDILKLYHKDNNLEYTFAQGKWFDAGTHDSILEINKYLISQ